MSDDSKTTPPAESTGKDEMQFGLHLTERAADEIRTIFEGKDLSPEGAYIRVAVKGGGCSGFNYLLDITETPSQHDNVYEEHGIRIVCDPKSYLYLNGTTVDFKDELMGRGFVFDNPNAARSCGCGSSFSV